jgi:nucleoside-diphosphate-sugar epimerase
MAEIAAGTAAIYNCANPKYHRWAQDWPPIANALRAAAARSGAVLATVSNLYGYGEVSGPMTEQQALAATGTKGRVRAQMWQEALADHEAGRIRATEVRGSDYLGPRSESSLGDLVVPRLLAGKPGRIIGAPDAPHTYTYTGDMARMIVVAASQERAWGRPWHVPSHEARTARAVVTELAAAAGVPDAGVRQLPGWALRSAGIFVPLLRELTEVRHQHVRPWVMDSSAAQQEFGVSPTPWDEIVRNHVAPYLARSRAA